MSLLRARLLLNDTLIAVITRSFVSGVEQSMIGVVLQPFVLSLGASMAQLGLFSSLAGFGGLIPTVASPWGGWIADQRGRKVVLLGASLAALGAFATFAVAGWMVALLLILPAMILYGIAQIYQPVSNALVAEAVGQRRRGSAYSLIMVAMTVPGIFAPVLAGALADRVGFTIIFPVAVVFEIAAFIVMWRYLSEIRAPRRDENGWRAVLAFLQRAWVPPHEIRWFFVAVALDLFAWGMGFGILYGMLTREYGFTTTELGVLSAVTNLTWAIVSLPIGRLIDWLGTKPVLVVSEAIGPPLMLIWMTQTRFEIFAMSMILFGITAASWIPTRNVYVTQTIEPARRGEVFGRLTAFSGLVAFPSAFIGGWLYDNLGFYAPLMGNLIFAFITVCVLVFLVHAPKKGEEVWQNAIPTLSE